MPHLARTPLIAVASTFVLAACGSDGTGPDDEINLVAAGGTDQVAGAGRRLSEPVSVRVVDGTGAPVAGVSVTFSASDGGSVDPSQILSDASGMAETRWLLGQAVTTQTLTVRARTRNLEITAEAVNGCDSRGWPELPVGEVTEGTLTPAACDLGGGVVGDIYRLEIDVQQALTIQMTAVNDAFLLMGPASDLTAVVALDDDGLVGTDSEVRILLAPGSYLVYASHFPGTALGAYALSPVAGGGDSDLCPFNLWVVDGVVTNQQLTDTDCEFEDGSRFDIFSVALNAGVTLIVDQSSAAFDPLLRRFNEAGFQVEVDDDGGPGSDARLVHTAGAGLELPFIGAGAATVDGRGAHVTSVQIQGGAQSRGTESGVRLPLKLLQRKKRR